MYFKYELALNQVTNNGVLKKFVKNISFFNDTTILLLQVAQPGSVPMVVNTTRPRTDYMVPAVLSCLCCFCPTGIFAILAASRVMSFTFAYNIIMPYTFVNNIILSFTVACLQHYIDKLI